MGRFREEGSSRDRAGFEAAGKGRGAERRKILDLPFEADRSWGKRRGF